MNRKDFIAFIQEFRKDLEHNKSKWGNQPLESFLEAMESYTEDVQGYYDNMNLVIDADQPIWENFMTILKGASVYE